jgi:hypothetical protein
MARPRRTWPRSMSCSVSCSRVSVRTWSRSPPRPWPASAAAPACGLPPALAESATRSSAGRALDRPKTCARRSDDTDARREACGCVVDPTERATSTPVFKTVSPRDLSYQAAPSLQHIDERLSLSRPYGGPEPPSELAEFVAAWDRLPEAVRAGIVAMVKASNLSGPPRPAGRRQTLR